MRASFHQGQRPAWLQIPLSIGYEMEYSFFQVVIGSYVAYIGIGFLSLVLCGRELGKRVVGEWWPDVAEDAEDTASLGPCSTESGTESSQPGFAWVSVYSVVNELGPAVSTPNRDTLGFRSAYGDASSVGNGSQPHRPQALPIS